MKIAVCPHDSAKNKSQWLYFITYISQKTGLELTMEQCLDFDCYYRSFPEVDMTYSNPLDALKIHRERGFIPLAGNDNYDEVVIISGRDAESSLEAIRGQGVLCVENQFATYLGMKILSDKGIDFSPLFRDSWQAVLTDIAKGIASYGMLYKDFWEQLSPLSKRDVKVVYESQEKLSSHLVMLSPEHKEHAERITDTLLNMPKDPEGAEILKPLKIGEWYPVKSLDYLEEILRR